MKKILLIAMAAMMVGVTNAQVLKSSKGNKEFSATQRPALMEVKKEKVVKQFPLMQSKYTTTSLNMGQQLSLSQKAKKTLKACTPAAAKAAPAKASALKDSYLALGTNRATNVKDYWTLKTGVNENQAPCLIDVLPLPKALDTLKAIAIPYEQVEDKITIKPTVVAQGEDEEGAYYILLFSGVDEEGNINLTVGEDGKLSTMKGDVILYGYWDQPEYKYDENDEGEVELVGYQGYLSIYEGVQYLTEDETPVPEARYEAGCTYYHIGSSTSGYGYIANLAVMPPYVNVPFKNLTTDLANSWSWSMAQLSYNESLEDYEEAEVMTDTTFNFSIQSLPEVYSPAKLTASYAGKAGDPFSWGLPTEYNGGSYDPYIYGGEVTNSMQFSDGTYATLTRANTDDFGYYYSGSYLTPGKSTADYTISTLISYQGKPAAPLYLTGVRFGVYQLELKEDFNLKCKIQKMSFDEEGRVVLGDVLAESEITYDDVNVEDGCFSWTEFYVEDEWGMTETVDHLFVEDEFAIVIEGWDNGTFDCYSLIDGCEFGNVANTYFIETGDEEQHIYHFVSGAGYQHLDIGIYGGWGYLHTEDPTDLAFNKDGGSSTIHVDPMLYSTDDETGEPTYSLFVESVTEDGEEADEIPEWVSVEIANEDYSKDEEGNFIKGIDYDMVVTAEPLPEGVESRTCQIVFMQTGAKLTVTITQNIEDAGVTGDLNGDKKVDIADAVTVLNIMAAGEYNAAADINGDQKVDIADFVSVLNIMAAQ